METAPNVSQAAPATVPIMPEQPLLVVELHYGMTNDLRYLSHHDELRMLIRTLTRAAWPLLYTRGFNPIPRLTMPLPRSTGIAAADQLALVDLHTADSAGALADRARIALPAAAPLVSLRTYPRRPALQACGVAFSMALPQAVAASAAAAIPAFLAQPEFFVERDMGPDKPVKRVEIRKFVRSLQCAPDGVLHMEFELHNQGTARPAEVLGALCVVPQDIGIPTTRTRVDWGIDSQTAADAAL